MVASKVVSSWNSASRKLATSWKTDEGGPAVEDGAGEVAGGIEGRGLHRQAAVENRAREDRIAPERAGGEIDLIVELGPGGIEAAEATGTEPGIWAELCFVGCHIGKVRTGGAQTDCEGKTGQIKGRTDRHVVEIGLRKKKDIGLELSEAVADDLLVGICEPSTRHRLKRSADVGLREVAVTEERNDDAVHARVPVRVCAIC